MSSDPALRPFDACLERLDALSETLSQWLRAPVTLTPSDPVPLASAEASTFGSGRWLTIAMGEASNGLLAVLSESVLPPETFEDNEEQSRGLTEAAGGLVRLLSSEAADAEAFGAAPVTDLSETIRNAEPSDAAQLLTLSVKWGDEKEGTLLLIGPVANALAAARADGLEAPTSADDTAEADDATAHSSEDLPPAVRALLKVAVPVSVTLAEKKMPLGQILDLGPGMIVQFDKSCDDLIDLNVNWHKIGQGEAMKVGEEFGIKITEIFSPAERAAILARTPKPKQRAREG